MKKVSHILKDSKSTTNPQHVVFFDTETYEQPLNDTESEHKFRLGVACYWRIRSDRDDDQFTWQNASDPADIWAFIFAHTGQRRNLFVVAHNVAFDVKVTQGFDRLRGEGYTLKKMILNGTTNIWKFRKDKSSITILDNMNYFKVSLAKLGDSLGVQKLKMPPWEASNEEWFIYCRRDVEVMLEAWRKWIEFLTVNDLGVFAMTIASQSLNAYRHRFMPAPIYIHAYDDLTKLEREAYHGGRTEAFFIGTLPPDTYRYLDVNSMYPHVMLSREYPTRYIGRRKNPPKKWLLDQLLTNAVIATVDIKTDEPVFPVKKDGRLIFPIGTFTTTLSTRELEYAASNDMIKTVHEAAIYEKARIFEDYVTFFYNKRLEYKRDGNDAFAYMCKLLLNSLYGKFGQRNDEYTIIAEGVDQPDGTHQEFDIDTKTWVTYRIINGTVEMATGKKEGFNSFVAIAAHITADARMQLWEYITKAGPNNTFYVDTDSLFVGTLGYSNLAPHIESGTLGALGLKGEADRLEIRGLKDYSFGEVDTIKGIRNDAERVDDSTFRQISFEGLKGALRKNRINTMVTRKVEKHLTRKYSKGNVSTTGFVYPFRLDR